MKNKISIFWFRRDLRFEDNTGLFHALSSGYKVLPIFIFDEEILSQLPVNDARVSFIYDTLFELDKRLKKEASSLLIKKGNVIDIWQSLLQKYEVASVYFNKDYEPYAIERDLQVQKLLKTKKIKSFSYKDQVIYEEQEIVKKDGKPYTVYTPYKNEWLKRYHLERCVEKDIVLKDRVLNWNSIFPSIETIGFETSDIKVKLFQIDDLHNYHNVRDFPYIDKTSYVSPYLRFGLISIRKMVIHALQVNQTFLNELIWREFFMQILYNFPRVVTENFKTKYNAIVWRNNQDEFQKWCKGETGYPIVDAGMKELNNTGYMHNRVRMIVASFLCKHLLIDWRWGEAYFAQKLLDYELASNNGNWQWAASTGCDAVPYFRIFNPTTQLKRFDSKYDYVKKWLPNLNELSYPKPIVDHKFARIRALDVFKKV